MVVQASGFREREHTADWELEIWAPDLPGLLEQAAYGMFWLMGARLQAGARQSCNLEFSGADPESLLVSFLQELLYLSDSQGLGFDEFRVMITGQHGRAELGGAPLVQLGKEIKAVTYHNLSVVKTTAGLEAIVVFDV